MQPKRPEKSSIALKLPGYSLIFLSLFSSCGYRWQPDYPCSTRPTIAIPFIPGDEDGTLTSTLIQALGSSGLVGIRNGNADYRLEVAILENGSETIGFRTDPQQISGKTKKNLVACEGRKTMKVEATLYEGESDTIAYGPYEITADADYDYIDGDSLNDLVFLNQEAMPTTVLPFSLGQLEPNESAQETATRPLYAQLAQKMVDAISAEW